MDLYVGAIVIVAALLGARVMLRREQRRRFGTYIEVYRTTPGSGPLPESVLRQFREENVRYRILYKRPSSLFFIGMSRGQPASLEVNIEDVSRAKRIIAQASRIER